MPPWGNLPEPILRRGDKEYVGVTKECSVILVFCHSDEGEIKIDEVRGDRPLLRRGGKRISWGGKGISRGDKGGVCHFGFLSFRR